MTSRLTSGARKVAWHAVRGLTGIRISVPVQYFDTELFGAAFPVSTDKVRELLPGDLLVPEEVDPGRTALEIWAYDHQRVDLVGPYKEVSVFVPVRYAGGAARHGAYVLSLPVTTEDARWGGVKIYGLPKFVADVRYEALDDGRKMRAVLRDEDAEILEFEVPTVGLPLKQSQHTRGFFGVLGDHLAYGQFTLTGHMTQQLAPGAASLKLGDHALGRLLASLEPDLTSRAHVFGEHLAGVLHAHPEILPMTAVKRGRRARTAAAAARP